MMNDFFNNAYDKVRCFYKKWEKEMGGAKFTMVFSGEGVDDGVIDSSDLGYALIYIGDLMRTANKALNGDNSQMTVKMVSTKQGSFEVDLILVQSLIERATSLFDIAFDNKDRISTANDLMDLLFKGAGAAGGFIMFLKFLNGKRPDKNEEKENVYHVYRDGKLFVISKPVMRLALSVAVRDAARKAFSILLKDGINAVKIKYAGNANLEITRDDLKIFEYGIEEDQPLCEKRIMRLQIVNLSFREDKKWCFYNGRYQFNAIIEDINFLNKVTNNEVSFAKGDYLTCIVYECQLKTVKGLKMEHSIIEVQNHEKSTPQFKLL